MRSKYPVTGGLCRASEVRARTIDDGLSEFKSDTDPRGANISCGLLARGPVSRPVREAEVLLQKAHLSLSLLPGRHCSTRHQSTGRWSRHRAGDSPNSRLNARLNASLDP